MAVNSATSLKIQSPSPYIGAECIGIQKPNPVKRIESLRKTQEIPKSIEIRPKAIETYAGGIGSKLNLFV